MIHMDVLNADIAGANICPCNRNPTTFFQIAPTPFGMTLLVLFDSYAVFNCKLKWMYGIIDQNSTHQ
jgi:hypothetical protein